MTNRFVFLNCLLKTDRHIFVLFFFREFSIVFIYEKTKTTEATRKKRTPIEQHYSSFLLLLPASFLTDEPRRRDSLLYRWKMCQRTLDPTRCRRKEKNRAKKKSQLRQLARKEICGSKERARKERKENKQRVVS